MFQKNCDMNHFVYFLLFSGYLILMFVNGIEAEGDCMRSVIAES